MIGAEPGRTSGGNGVSCLEIGSIKGSGGIHYGRPRRFTLEFGDCVENHAAPVWVRCTLDIEGKSGTPIGFAMRVSLGLSEKTGADAWRLIDSPTFPDDFRCFRRVP
ncbi:hypothetical protein RSSM_00106 [Rhodopirellula sallentina SM41]|uniref:Uncharacterized protein n=1 Tax=Rhodopirellula sallentina SM41 TaxID=1263870 RepID=M5UKP5_9BACT|nr:hypothetical protein RSSM_00106 [Rhodopirellula sallentina SM41]